MEDHVCKPAKKGYRPFQPLKDNTIVTITIGKDLGEGQDFSVPREYLTSISDYFANTFNGKFREATDKKVSLGNVRPQSFGIFLEWLYGRTLVDENGAKYNADNDAKKNITHTPRFMDLLDLYLFADEYDVPQFRRDVLEVFIDYQYSFPKICSADVITKAFEHLPPASPMLRFLVDVTIHSWIPTPGIVGWSAESLPATFLFQTTSKMCSMRNGNKVSSKKSPYANKCDYHEHDGERDEEGDAEK